MTPRPHWCAQPPGLSHSPTESCHCPCALHTPSYFHPISSFLRLFQPDSSSGFGLCFSGRWSDHLMQRLRMALMNSCGRLTLRYSGFLVIFMLLSSMTFNSHSLTPNLVLLFSLNIFSTMYHLKKIRIL